MTITSLARQLGGERGLDLYPYLLNVKHEDKTWLGLHGEGQKP